MMKITSIIKKLFPKKEMKAVEVIETPVVQKKQEEISDLRALEHCLINRLSKLLRDLDKLNLSQMERETMMLDYIKQKMSEYWGLANKYDK